MSKKCLIYETYNPVNEMRVSKNNEGLMTLSGTFGCCGVRNNNNRVYEAGNYGKMVTEMKKRIKENGAIPGQLEHPNTMNIELENVSHKITDINIDENGVVSGTIQLLNTPKGKIAQAIVEGGLPLYVSSRAMGQVDKDGNVKLEQLQTYDLVGSPGFSQAKMHLNESQLFESLGDNTCAIINEKDNNIVENNTDILERLEALEERIQDLEEQNEDLQEQLDEKQDINLKQLANGIQSWIVEQFAPEIQKWVVEQYDTKVKTDIGGAVQSWIVEQFAPEIQKWIVEQYSPEIQKWVTNEYSPIVEKWFLESVCPNIQDWMFDEYAPTMEKWLNECYSQKVKGILTESKDSKLKSIADTLAVLEQAGVTKPIYPGATQINEHNDPNEPVYIKNMPDKFRPQYNMASREVKESINRRAKLFDFTTEGAIDRFWEGIKFDEIKPAKSIYEGLQNIPDIRERNIRASFRRFRNR